MKILLAPAKQMKYRETTKELTSPIFHKKTKELHNLFQFYSVEEIRDLMKVSQRIAEEVYFYYQMSLEKRPALHFYWGTVYRELTLEDYQKKEEDYLDNYLRILSAFYGVLSPYDAISPYRLDMTMKPNGINLYQYWKEAVAAYFNEEELIISLASKEFSSMVDHPNLVHIDFIEKKKGKLTRPSMKIKQARGKMLDIMVKNQLTKISDIQNLSFDNYHYRPDMSHPHNLVFFKELEL